jgi:NtrC-family two-component system response regulator AlgB
MGKEKQHLMEATAATAPQRILIVDDELNIRKTLSMCLEADGHDVYAVSNAEDTLAEVARRSFDIVFLDLRIGSANGLDLIPPLLSAAPWLKIVVITAHASIDTAVEAMRRGATDYLPKPFTPAQVSMAAQKAASLRQLEQRLDALQDSAMQEGPIEIRSEAPAMQAVYAQAEQVAHSNAAVLIRGENGTGKTLLARAIHQWSPRASKPMAVVSCPSLSTTLLESELFGHVKGAFTSAVKDNPGRIAKCEGGTLFLDEIGDMPAELQAKMLRFLQDKEYERVGDTVTRKADVRVITATNVNLDEAVRQGRFREDLLYRLNVVEINIPPLRNRKEDILLMAEGMLAQFALRDNKRISGFSEAARQALLAHDWPGNVRELRNVIERATIFCTGDLIGPEHLPGAMQEMKLAPAVGDLTTLEQIEEQHIRRVLASTKSLQEAADILGIDQATLWRRRKKYGI